MDEDREPLDFVLGLRRDGLLALAGEFSHFFLWRKPLRVWASRARRPSFPPFFAAAASRYQDPDRGAELVSYLEEMTTAEQRAARLARLRWQRQAALAWVADLDQMAAVIEEARDEH